MNRRGDWHRRLDLIVAETRPVTDALAARGHRVYLVGGIVRDLLLDRQRLAPDIDLTTDAVPARVIECLRDIADDLWTQGERFGTIGCRVGGRTFEVTTHRSEAYVSDSRKPVVEYSADVEVDLSRRDFTVNAMAVEIPARALIDPFGGASDLRAGRLDTPLAPEVSFSDDPLRMLRAARFAAGYQLTPTPAVERAMGRLRSRLAIVSRERVRDELDRLIEVDDPTSGFLLLLRTGVLAEFLPELHELHELGEDELTQTLEIVRRAPTVDLRRAGLFALVSDRRAVASRLAALRYSNAQRRDVAGVLHVVDEAAARAEPDAEWVRRTVQRHGSCVDRALQLRRLIVGVPAVAALDELIDRLRATGELESLEPELDGDDVQRMLGIAEGRQVGEALGYLLELRLAEGRVGRAEAERRLRAWWQSPRDG